ncbi:MAG: arginine deiminase-related protein [Vicinamibacterales bacterium]
MIALTRDVSPLIARCELTHLVREPIDVDRARAQHRAYEDALTRLGCSIRRVPGAEAQPDAVFIEDTAVVLPELAIIARPGAASRRPEVDAVASALTALRDLVRIEEPGTLDGGDVLVVGTQVFVGRSSRTNDSGIEQLRNALAPMGYRTTAVDTTACLHLKSAACALGSKSVLINPQWVPFEVFQPLEVVEIDTSESHAANIVSLGVNSVLASEAFPRTCALLERRGFEVVRVDVSELAKAEGALTCCSLLVS